MRLRDVLTVPPGFPEEELSGGLVRLVSPASILNTWVGQKYSQVPYRQLHQSTAKSEGVEACSSPREPILEIDPGYQSPEEH